MHEEQHVPVNMYETDQAVVLVLPLPGVMSDDLQVTVDGRTLSVKAGERSQAEKRDYLLNEWHYGPYERTVELPDGFGGKGEASFANGQLAIRVEKGDTGGPGPRTVPVAAKP